MGESRPGFVVGFVRSCEVKNNIDRLDMAAGFGAMEPIL
jgi:hypothetical protein